MEPAWRPWRRVLFRFAFVWLTLLCLRTLVFCVPITNKPPLSWLTGLYWRAWGWIVQLMTERLLGFTPAGRLEGSDSEAAWLMLLWTTVLSIAVAGGWTLVAKRREYRRLEDVHRTLVRHTLGAAMLFYGIDKLLELQFWGPTATDRVQTFGQSSPFALAWRFMGSSPTYVFFGGLMECVGGMLLLWRRTALAGALVLAGVLLNVVMLNFCYAIPVKQLSTMFLVFALYVALPDLLRVLDLLVLHRPVAPRELRPFRFGPRGELVRSIVKALWIVSLVGTITLDLVTLHADRLGGTPETPLAGAYDVEEIQRDGVAVPLVITDARIWQQVAFGYAFGDVATIITVDGARHLLGYELDEASGTMKAGDEDDNLYTFKIEHPDATHLVLTGDYQGQHLRVRLRAHDLSGSLLTSWGFHLVDDGGHWQ
jgi:hypothetical protein